MDHAPSPPFRTSLPMISPILILTPSTLPCTGYAPAVTCQAGPELGRCEVLCFSEHPCYVIRGKSAGAGAVTEINTDVLCYLMLVHEQVVFSDQDGCEGNGRRKGSGGGQHLDIPYLLTERGQLRNT